MIAQVAVGLFQRPKIRSVTGFDVAPVGGWLYYQALQELETARITRPSGELAALQAERLAGAEQRADYLRRSAGELTYLLDCRDCRAAYLRSLPALLAEVRAADTGRVVLARQPQDVA